MRHQSNRLTGARLNRFKVFCQHVGKIEETSELISFVSNDPVYVNFCRDIFGSDKTYQDRFVEFCQKNQFDADKARERLSAVATVLGVGKFVDYYKALGVEPDADEQTIRTAYREKAPYFHPDRVNGNDLNSDQFAELHAGYVHLTDPVLRENYDQLINLKGNWIEGQEWEEAEEVEEVEEWEEKKSGPNFLAALIQGVRSSRFFNLLSFSLGLIVCFVIVIAIDTYRKRSAPLSPKRSAESLLEKSETGLHVDLNKSAEVEFGSKSNFPGTDKTLTPDGQKNHLANKRLAGSDQVSAISNKEGVIFFYNPRRPKRYWSSDNSRHDNFKDAIQHLAVMYQRSPDWVTRYMGVENDLSAIHHNLIEQKVIERLAEKRVEKVMPARVQAPDQKDLKDAGTVVSPTEAMPNQASLASKKKIPHLIEQKAIEGLAEKRAEKVMPARVQAPDQKDLKDAGTVVSPTEAMPNQASLASKEKIPSVQKVEIVVNPSKPAAQKMVATAVSAKANPLAKESTVDATPQLEKQRILEFLENYANAYEQKDIEQFGKYFTPDAQEMGQPFRALRPKYQNTFDSVDALRYKIDLKAFSMDKVNKIIHLNGVFTAAYRLPEKDWKNRSGSFRMELLDSDGGLLVKRLEYEMDP
jgi:curved DNA-binding protein CbpA